MKSLRARWRSCTARVIQSGAFQRRTASRPVHMSGLGGGDDALTGFPPSFSLKILSHQLAVASY